MAAEFVQQIPGLEKLPGRKWVDNNMVIVQDPVTTQRFVAGQLIDNPAHKDYFYYVSKGWVMRKRRMPKSNFPSEAIHPASLPLAQPAQGIQFAYPQSAPHVASQGYVSQTPSAYPSVYASQTPSAYASQTPSAYASQTPSAYASQTPSAYASAYSSQTPSAYPSAYSSQTPSAYPSVYSSQTPSAYSSQSAYPSGYADSRSQSPVDYDQAAAYGQAIQSCVQSVMTQNYPAQPYPSAYSQMPPAPPKTRRSRSKTRN